MIFFFSNTVATTIRSEEPGICNVIDEGPAYEVVAARDGGGGKTSVTQHQSPEKSGENVDDKFVLKECPAYGPVSAEGKKSGADDLNVYETVSSV